MGQVWYDRPKPDQHSHTQKWNMPESIIFGAGNIGRGFIGQLFSESGFALTLVDIDQILLDAINARGAYIIRLVDNVQAVELSIHPVKAIHASDRESVVQTICRADLGATAVGARALPHIAPLVAEGITRRFQNNKFQPFNLIVCENLKDAAFTFRQMVNLHLSHDVKEYADAHLGLVDAVIGRMVPPPTPEMRNEDPGLILVEPYKELPVDRSGFIGDIPHVISMQPCDNFPAYTARKLYIHNCGHACLAYLGFLSRYEFGYQALADPKIFEQLNMALGEAKSGIVKEYGVEPEWLDEHIADLLRRFTNRALGDTIFRLGRDPLRKLAPTDRLVGAARLAEKAGIEPLALCAAVAAGYCFDPVDDPMAVKMQERLAADGIEKVITEVSGILPDETLGRGVIQEYITLQKKKR
jgi:mannitol-1-phosphate 5-dehydrogenase